MQIETTRFGAISVDENRVITFPEGLPGFEEHRRFMIVPHPSASDSGGVAFQWLQSVEDGTLAFLAMEPSEVFPNYAPRVPAAELEAISVGEKKAAPCLYTLLTVPKGNPCGITANLMAPVVVNHASRLAKQVVVSGDDYGLRHRLLPEQPA